jgi:hypothetical protein
LPQERFTDIGDRHNVSRSAVSGVKWQPLAGDTHMVEGFWIVQYEGLKDKGGGVAVFTKGQILGGDSGTTYIGNYQTDEKTIKGRVRIHNFLPGVVSVIGVEGDYDLDVAGTIEGDVIKGTGSPVGHDVAGLAFRMTRAANLPA